MGLGNTWIYSDLKIVLPNVYIYLTVYIIMKNGSNIIIFKPLVTIIDI